MQLVCIRTANIVYNTRIYTSLIQEIPTDWLTYPLIHHYFSKVIEWITVKLSTQLPFRILDAHLEAIMNKYSCIRDPDP